jgi:hypothetical protein
LAAFFLGSAASAFASTGSAFFLAAFFLASGAASALAAFAFGLAAASTLASAFSSVLQLLPVQLLRLRVLLLVWELRESDLPVSSPFVSPSASSSFVDASLMPFFLIYS